MNKVCFLPSEFSKSEQDLLRTFYGDTQNSNFDTVVYKENGRTFLKDKSSKNPFFIDFLSGELIFRLKSSGKKQPLLKALQIGTNVEILDGTAGLGRDALTLAYHGAHVIALERNPILFLMLQEALVLLNKDSLIKNFKGSIHFEYADTATYVQATTQHYDAIYLDPMYPAEDKDAKSKKEITVLKNISLPTENLEGLIQSCLPKVRSRVVLKRPPQSKYVGRPTSSNTSNLVRFDIYIP